MPKVFVHGNPETAAVWGPLLAELERAGAARSELICLSPYGFGAPLPTGFGATVGEYRDWLIGELEKVGEPVDLVGHDWGGGHVVNVAIARPDLLRSWASDVVGAFDRDYVWHELAQRWQTPGVGEADVAERFGAALETRVVALVERGVNRPVAEQIAAAQDETMGRAVLALYRSAAQPMMSELGRDLERASQRPGLAILATEDHMVGTERQRRRAAQRAGARVETLDGLGHWWMTQDPARGARALTEFWARC
ncbi:alpha/beta hydrolase [Streptomyces luomodiensis]|uniref:Alpha/beta hydrolase n=1 Tax=Streptomyces luomodiensis TaxID=3026192 RepID=A0ABY9UNY2_9ACTN|nr:alpha/beta hydrolase [Streptomyces sp. SCA4-21]WNE94242.1 alpha/beta hydrolase [Streptomyces sp. SCA4-21]